MSGQVFSKPLPNQIYDEHIVKNLNDVSIVMDNETASHSFMTYFAKNYSHIYKDRVNKRRKSEKDPHFCYYCMAVIDAETKKPIKLWVFKDDKKNEKKLKNRLRMNNLKLMALIKQIGESMGLKYCRGSKQAYYQQSFRGMKFNSDYQNRSHCKFDYQIVRVTTYDFESDYSDIGTNVDLMRWETYYYDVKIEGKNNGCMALNRGKECVDRMKGQRSPNIPKI